MKLDEDTLKNLLTYSMYLHRRTREMVSASADNAIGLYTPEGPVSYTHLTLPTNREV